MNKNTTEFKLINMDIALKIIVFLI